MEGETLWGSAKALQQVDHELRQALEVADKPVEGGGEAGELAGEHHVLLLLLSQLQLEASGELLEGGAAFGEVSADGCVLGAVSPLDLS